jgi:hypothetical protein
MVVGIALGKEEVRNTGTLLMHSRGTSKTRGLTSANPRCEHDAPIAATPTETGYYYAWCLRCHEVGPERATSEAARQALQQVQGLISDEQRSSQPREKPGALKNQKRDIPYSPRSQDSPLTRPHRLTLSARRNPKQLAKRLSLWCR